MLAPILICIPYWNGDKAQAIELCRILAGLQPHHVKNTAHVLLVARQDCIQDQNMVQILRPKFNTFTYQTNSPLRGWPSGANGMFATTMIHIANSAAQNYECVYWMEPDCIPICPNWFWDLVITWRSRPQGVNVVGCRSDCNGDGSGDHITGCALYDPNIVKLLPEITRSDKQAWDYQHRARIVAMGMHTKMIENWYHARNAEPGILDRTNVGVAIIHGFKDSSLTKLVKSKYRIP